MSVAIETILGGANLTGVVNSVKGGVPVSTLPPAFLAVSRRIIGNTESYLKVEGNRQTAKLVQRGSPSKARALKGVSDQTFKTLHCFEHIHHKAEVLESLRSPLTNVQDQGAWEIARQSLEFSRYFTNLRVSAVYSALALGKIHFDISGNLLPTSSNAVTTIDFGVPAGNQDSIGGIIAAKWSTASTDIIGQVEALKQYALELTGYELTTAFYGTGIKNYLGSNTAVAAMLNGNAAYQQSLLNGGIPNGFLGLNWLPFNKAFFADKDGTIQKWIAADDIIFTPDVDSSWYDFVEGSNLIPNSINISADGASAVGNLTQKYGQFSYATIETDPVAIKHMAGDEFLPLIKVPKAIFRAGVNL
jgi:hypothetical protein